MRNSDISYWDLCLKIVIYNAYNILLACADDGIMVTLTSHLRRTHNIERRLGGAIARTAPSVTSALKNRVREASHFACVEDFLKRKVMAEA